MPYEPSTPSPARRDDDATTDRLDSWKDIAAYLKRDVSTVQRWEKRERMPVYRHHHDRLGTVYGFRSELDAWWRGRTSVTPRPTHAAESAIDPEGAPEILSLAVLPLDNPTNDPAQEYVADGMTQALITELGKIASLRVIARASVMKYKGVRAAPGEVAGELCVQALVTGSVVRSCDRVTITVQLVDPGSALPTWSEVYERDLRDVLALQREVILAIAGRVRATFTAPEQARLDKVRQVNPDAYECVLRARYLSVRTTDADSRAAIGLLDRAIALDPELASAHAELAAAYVNRLGFVTPEDTSELEQKAFAAAETALALDPDVPEAYLARGDLLWTHAHHFAHLRAAQEFRLALSLNPNSDQAHRRLARIYVHVGRFEDALHHAAIAIAINPVNSQALNSRAEALLWMGNDEEALAILRSIPRPVLPELVEAHCVFALLRLGRRDEARSHLARALASYPCDVSGSLPGVEAMLCAESEPHRVDALLETIARRKAVNPAHHGAYFAACACARMQRPEDAVGWLEQAVATGLLCYPLIAHDANLDPIRHQACFQGFMADLQRRCADLHQALFPDRG